MDTPTDLAARKTLIDEFGGLSRERDAWTPKGKRMDALAVEIRAWYPDLAADQTALAVGTLYEIQVGEKSIEKTWKSIAAVCKAAGGWPKFQKLCDVTFKALAGVLGNSAAEALQTEARTGNRRLKAVARVAPAVVELPEVIELPKAA
jgi:hypothetical protein